MKQLILSHVGTDFDGLACMVLAQRLYQGSELVFPGRLAPGVKEFYNLHKRHFPILPLKSALAQKPTRMILVDTRVPSRLGDFRTWCHDPDIELHIYDHHPATAEGVRGNQEWVESLGACATLLVERCRKRDIGLSTQEATLALIAIHEETGSFRFSSTHPRDLQAASFLLESGANLELVRNYLKDPLDKSQVKLLEEFLSNGKIVEGPAGSLYLSWVKRKKSVFGLGLMAHKVLELEGCEACCLMLESPGKGTSIAARSVDESWDMADWMSRLGGGGHRKAAATSKLKESAEELMELLASWVPKVKRQSALKAADIMSTDLFTIGPDLTCQEAHAELLNRGFSACCVLDDKGELLGLVSTLDLQKALDHKLAHAPARSVMTHKVISVDHQESLEEIRRIVVQRQVGSLPVLREGQLVGIVTRTDLLRDLYRHETENQSDLVPQAEELVGVSEPFATWLKSASLVASERGERVYAVGGFVRDLLMGRENKDLDLMVEGDAIGLARDLAEELGGKLLTHEKYLTASIKFEDGLKLDLATARRESYVRPAALPLVAQSNLKSDLYRRDFTVNALALRLEESGQARVVDFFGGRQDLESKVIRILHNHSFLDDPYPHYSSCAI